jgi:hydrogenase maturation protein HypF
VAPRNPFLGTMLAYTPLHHLLLERVGSPVVATSGNLSDEPICTDEREAVERLGGIAELFLVHNRPIARHVDDSIVRVIAGREIVLRRARGYAPLPIHLNSPAAQTLAVGAHLKNAVAAAIGCDVFLSQHIGDLETAQAVAAFEQVIHSFENLYELRPSSIACDLHPDYRSTHFAQASGLTFVPVQHHYAHVLACMAENELEAPVLGVAWDGTGYGTDGTIWGGEFLTITPDSFKRTAHLHTFRLPGGERAAREPRRSGLGLLYDLIGDEIFALDWLKSVSAFSRPELQVLKPMLVRGLNSPLTSSAGRLFDAVASIIGLRQEAGFEGQAAMELEFALDGVETDERYPVELVAPIAASNPAVVDWAMMIQWMLDDLRRQVSRALISAKFHNTLVEAILRVARYADCERVALTGGCFQNRYLTERAVGRLSQEGFRPYWHQRVPPNDGGIALGQVVAAAREQLRKD